MLRCTASPESATFKQRRGVSCLSGSRGSSKGVCAKDVTAIAALQYNLCTGPFVRKDQVLCARCCHRDDRHRVATPRSRVLKHMLQVHGPVHVQRYVAVDAPGGMPQQGRRRRGAGDSAASASAAAAGGRHRGRKWAVSYGSPAASAQVFSVAAGAELQL